MCSELIPAKLASRFHNVWNTLDTFYFFIFLRLTKCNTHSLAFGRKNQTFVISSPTHCMHDMYFAYTAEIEHTRYFMPSAIFVSSIPTSCSVMPFVFVVKPFQIIVFQALPFVINLEHRIKNQAEHTITSLPHFSS